MYYSAIKPEPNPEVDKNLPHITIQMPVYKESLEFTMCVSSILSFCGFSLGMVSILVLMIRSNFTVRRPCTR